MIDSACNFFPTFSMNPLAPKHLVAACQRVVRTLDGTASPVVWTTIGNGPLPSGTPGVVAVVTAATEAPSNSECHLRGHQLRHGFCNQQCGSGQRCHMAAGHTSIAIQEESLRLKSTRRTTKLLISRAIQASTRPPIWERAGRDTESLTLIYRDVAIDPAYPQHIFAASNAGVFASTDGGIHWGNMSEGIPSGMVVSSLSFNAASRQLAASTYGRGVYMLNVGRPVQPTEAASHSASAGHNFEGIVCSTQSR